MTKGTLYRYSHPNDLTRFIYVGQGYNRDRFHRSGKSSFGRRFKEDFPNIELSQPIEEEFEIVDQAHLNVLETVWIFQFKTWYKYGGMNITLPGSTDYKNLGKITGRINASIGHMNSIRTTQSCALGGRIGGRRRVELYGTPETPEGCAKGGRATGGHNARKLIAQGRGIFGRSVEQHSKDSQIAGRVNVKSGHMKSLGNSGIGLCYRWNIKRQKPCICGVHQ